MLHKTGDYVATTSGGAPNGKASSGIITRCRLRIAIFAASLRVL
jgi:hypothetical protein